jgi:ATP/maltotriose-dependent transcriptional regulator MalT
LRLGRRIHGGTTIVLEHDQAAGEPSYEAALALYRDLGDVRGEARILMRLAVHAGIRGDADEARRLMGVARSLTEALDVPGLEAQALATLGNLAEHDGDLEGALALYDRSAELSATCGFTLWETWMRNSAAEMALRLERYDAAGSRARQALERAWGHGDQRVSLLSLVLLACSALGRGDAERAGRLWGAVLAESEESGLSETHAVLELAAPLRVAKARGYSDALEIGLATPLETAVALALA